MKTPFQQFTGAALIAALVGLTSYAQASGGQIETLPSVGSLATDAETSGPGVSEFQSPPMPYRPQTWWHWMNGNVTREGITADLESMARVGIGGAHIFNVGHRWIPEGPLQFNSPQWHEMVKFTAQEAERLGLTLGFHNCPGWSSSGGPWVTTENAMQKLVTSETQVTGPSHFDAVLPQPPVNLDFYRDIVVLAFPQPDGEKETMASLAPTVTASIPNVRGEHLFDGNRDTKISLPRPNHGNNPFIQLEFDRPLTARSAWITLGEGGERTQGVVQSSEDGVTFRDLARFRFGHQPYTSRILSVSLGNNPDPARFYRIEFTGVGARLDVEEISISSALRTDDIEAKSGMNGGGLTGNPDVDKSPHQPGLVIDPDQIINLSAQMTADGKLTWDVPAGSWIIQRIGYTPTGMKNAPAPAGGEGLEVDKLSADAMRKYWDGHIQMILDNLGSLAGQGAALNSVMIDSYERFGQNWTPAFREDFIRLRGYDPLPWLATITGRVVGSPDLTDRFLWDMRRTIADLFAENYYGEFRNLCHQHGLKAYIEPYTGPFESLLSGGAADVPTGELWVDRNTFHYLKLVSSIGNIYGQQIVAIEAFTTAAGRGHGRWMEDPYALKALGDRAFCHGINQFLFHTYTMQPWVNIYPGMTMGPWGSHLERTVTWWEQGRAWMSYLARCQYMLQQGRYVADAAAFIGESPPVGFRPIVPALPRGYQYDILNADVLLHHASVVDGMLVLDSGMQYRVLALSQREQTMTPQVLRRLRDFVRQGLILVGPPPEHSPSLENYPDGDAEIKAIVAGMWGNLDGKTVTEHRLAKGRVIWGRDFQQIFEELGVNPAFEYAPASGAELDFIHRKAGDADIFFVSNQRQRFESLNGTFRVSGKIPELWHPDTGKMEESPVWVEKDGRITLPLQFDPSGSVFVVFRKNAENSDPIVAADFTSHATPPVPALTIHSARYEAVNNPEQGTDVVALITRQIHNDIRDIRVSNDAFGGDPALGHPKQLRISYTLDGQPVEETIKENASWSPVSLPAAEIPTFELSSAAKGHLTLHASAPGEVKLTFASGKSREIVVPHVPDSVSIDGPWTVTFPPQRGAPEQITLPKLASWTESSEPGVKYFSGTATYRKTFTRGEAKQRNERYILDLGDLHNIAEVELNGKDLGILWKPPYRLDVTDALVSGDNALIVKVTNLWPNRLIGDEHLPADREWNADGSLKAIPQWVIDGEPSPTGRITFTTWRHWKKEDKLLPSGLLGPVQIQTVKTVQVPK